MFHSDQINWSFVGGLVLGTSIAVGATYVSLKYVPHLLAPPPEEDKQPGNGSKHAKKRQFKCVGPGGQLHAALDC
jgi:hypothetical protein